LNRRTAPLYEAGALLSWFCNLVVLVSTM